MAVREVPSTMMVNSAADSEWLQWIELQKEVAKTWLEEGRPADATIVLDRYLTADLPEDLRREGTAFRAMLHREQGDLAAAKSDFLAALELAEDRDHVRFELEDSIAVISQELNDRKEAGKWYLSALRTAAADPRVVGGGFLLRYLRFRGDKNLTIEEKQLANKVVHQSWRLLQIDGEPDLENLEVTASRLIEAQQHPASSNESA